MVNTRSSQSKEVFPEAESKQKYPGRYLFPKLINTFIAPDEAASAAKSSKDIRFQEGYLLIILETVIAVD